jgi:hypothetical protein
MSRPEICLQISLSIVFCQLSIFEATPSLDDTDKSRLLSLLFNGNKNMRQKWDLII